MAIDSSSHPAFFQAMQQAADAIEQELDRLLTSNDVAEQRLTDAMRYACLGGGKRLRPFMLLETAKLFAVGARPALRCAAALELLHCYSLVHDDLPAMDDDDLRRGKPTVHIAFDEATAILAGDALLTMAFEVILHPDSHPNSQIRCDLAQWLAQAAGASGMVGGQMIDLDAPNRQMDIGAITRLQRLKTGRLFDFACQAGAILGKAAPHYREALRGYTRDLGLAFQMADDLLDVFGRSEDIGKRTQKDADHGKATFVSILGPERARDQAHHLADQAIEHLAVFGPEADHLRLLAQYVVTRPL